VTTLEKVGTGQLLGSAELDAYVYRVALNHFRNHCRKGRLRGGCSNLLRELAEQYGVQSLEPLEDAQHWQQAARFLGAVTPTRDREILERFYLREESKEDICRSLSLSGLHFNRVIDRARGRFRALLESHGLTKSQLLLGCFEAVETTPAP
jgi:DNA-directed RNA polymerase specialized sigma24 family protein